MWIVSGADQPTTSVWVDATAITVKDNGPPYTLVDTDDQETAEANYIGQE